MKKNSFFGSSFESGGGFYYYGSKIFDAVALSLMWLLGCIPVITAGASFSALYASASRSIRQDIGKVSAEYWKAFKRNIKSSIPIWLIFGGAIFVLLLNMGIIWNVAEGLFRLFVFMFYGIVLILVVTAFCYAFPALSRFEMPFVWIIKLAFYMTFRHLPISLVLIMMFGTGYFLALVRPWTIFILPGVIAWVASSMVDPLLDRHMPTETNMEVEI